MGATTICKSHDYTTTTHSIHTKNWKIQKKNLKKYRKILQNLYS